ncbi:MAG: hypothetical protein M1503_11570 [Thaumarchaeota archaeon]|nr:hypothetical protein [Nitrososphaerota archaeon]MCL5318882.1 hypothetical protein [Nitrososphaerota archaeon]
MPDNRIKLTESDRFEAYYRIVVNKESSSAVAKDKKVETSTITRAVYGNAQRNAPPFQTLLTTDPDLKTRYETWVKSRSEDFEGFEQSELAQKWLKSKGGKKSFTQFKKIVTGKIVKDFKINPLKFDKPQIQRFVELYKQQKGLDQDTVITQGVRRTLRSWILDARGENLTESEGIALGISGEKVNFGVYNDVFWTDPQIDTIYDIIPRVAEKHKLDPVEALGLWSAGIETFARTDRLFQLETSKPAVEDINGHQAFFFRILETKTDRLWPKIILDKRAVEAVKALIEVRKQKRFLFIDPEESQDIHKVSERKQDRYHPVFRDLNRELGIPENYEIGDTKGYFYRRPLYTLRHSGAHLWLRRRYKQTGVWDFAYVASMGWDDISTLMRCYGALPAEVLLNGVNGMIGKVIN